MPASPFQASGETSPGKNDDLPRTIAGSTPLPLGRRSFAVSGPLAPVRSASYPVPVRRLTGSFHASFSVRLTTNALRFPSVPATRFREDFHLQVIAHAGPTTNKKRPRSHRLRSLYCHPGGPISSTVYNICQIASHQRVSVRRTPDSLCVVRKNEAEYQECPGRNHQSHPDGLHVSRACRFDKHCLPSLLPGSLSTLSQLSDRHHRRYFRSMQKAGQTPLSQPSPDLKESAHKPYVIAPQQVTAIPRSVSLCCHRPGWGVWSAQCTPAIVPWAGRCCHVGSKYRSGLLGSQRSQACHKRYVVLGRLGEGRPSFRS